MLPLIVGNINAGTADKGIAGTNTHEMSLKAAIEKMESSLTENENGVKMVIPLYLIQEIPWKIIKEAMSRKMEFVSYGGTTGVLYDPDIYVEDHPEFNDGSTFKTWMNSRLFYTKHMKLDHNRVAWTLLKPKKDQADKKGKRILAVSVHGPYKVPDTTKVRIIFHILDCIIEAMAELQKIGICVYPVIGMDCNVKTSQLGVHKTVQLNIRFRAMFEMWRNSDRYHRREQLIMPPKWKHARPNELDFIIVSKDINLVDPRDHSELDLDPNSALDHNPIVLKAILSEGPRPKMDMAKPLIPFTTETWDNENSDNELENWDTYGGKLASLPLAAAATLIKLSRGQLANLDWLFTDNGAPLLQILRDCSPNFADLLCDLNISIDELQCYHEDYSQALREALRDIWRSVYLAKQQHY